MVELYLEFAPAPYSLQQTPHSPPRQPIINLCINLEQVQFEISNGIHSSVQAPYHGK